MPLYFSRCPTNLLDESDISVGDALLLLVVLAPLDWVGLRASASAIGVLLKLGLLSMLSVTALLFVLSAGVAAPLLLKLELTAALLLLKLELLFMLSAGVTGSMLRKLLSENRNDLFVRALREEVGNTMTKLRKNTISVEKNQHQAKLTKENKGRVSVRVRTRGRVRVRVREGVA
jgi:hypothetical protein